MRYGVVFPQTQLGADPAVLRDFAQAVEGMGYHHLLAYDHVLGANPDRPGWSGGRALQLPRYVPRAIHALRLDGCHDRDSRFQ